MDKSLIRKEILEKRSKLGRILYKEYSKTIMDTLSDSIYYKSAKTIMIFVSFNYEVDTREFIKKAIADGKDVVVPITIPETKQLIPSLLKDYSELAPGFYNILTPKEEFIRPTSPDLIDLIIVPGIAFDPEGYRVGYGGGYYDRFLSKIRSTVPKVSIAFHLQLIDKVPKDHFDIPVDYIFTEKEIIECSRL